MTLLADDGETTVRIIGRLGLNWKVVTDPAESRWFLGDVGVIRGFKGWYVTLPGRNVAWYRGHREALECAAGVYMTEEQA